MRIKGLDVHDYTAIEITPNIKRKSLFFSEDIEIYVIRSLSYYPAISCHVCMPNMYCIVLRLAYTR